MEGSPDNKEILLFGMPEEVGALAKALDIFKVFLQIHFSFYLFYLFLFS